MSWFCQINSQSHRPPQPPAHLRACSLVCPTRSSINIFILWCFQIQEYTPPSLWIVGPLTRNSGFGVPPTLSTSGLMSSRSTGGFHSSYIPHHILGVHTYLIKFSNFFWAAALLSSYPRLDCCYISTERPLMESNSWRGFHSWASRVVYE